MVIQNKQFLRKNFQFLLLDFLEVCFKTSLLYLKINASLLVDFNFISTKILQFNLYQNLTLLKIYNYYHSLAKYLYV